MRNLFVLIFFLISSSVFTQNKIQNKAIKYIIQKVGKSFYVKHISFNEKYSKKNMLLFNITIQQSPLIIKLLVINVNNKMEIDSINSNIDIKQLSKCIEKPDKCNLPMNETEAIEIAKKEGFGQDISQFEISFLILADDKHNFMWSIKKYKNKSAQNSGSFMGNGQWLTINAFTGQTKITYFSEKE